MSGNKTAQETRAKREADSPKEDRLFLTCPQDSQSTCRSQKTGDQRDQIKHISMHLFVCKVASNHMCETEKRGQHKALQADNGWCCCSVCSINKLRQTGNTRHCGKTESFSRFF